jgi:hypothetical protein
MAAPNKRVPGGAQAPRPLGPDRESLHSGGDDAQRPHTRTHHRNAQAWCAYLQGHARRLYASVTDRAQVAAALLAVQLAHGRLPSPFTARDVYRNAWTGLTEPRVVQGALEGLAALGWLRSEAVRTPAGGRPTVRFRINPRLLAGRHERSRHVPPEGFRRS